MKQIVQQLADENQRVDIETESEIRPSVDITFDIRDDEFDILEAEDGRLYIRTPDMPENVMAEVIPTQDGPITEVTTEVDVEELELCEPAEREESPDVDTARDAEIIMD